MYSLQITVTKDILERSKFCGYSDDVSDVGRNCAVAECIREILPEAYVHSTTIKPFKAINDRILLPPEATSFINAFDQTPPLQRPSLDEITFTIHIPDTIIERINIEEVTNLLSNHPTLKLYSRSEVLVMEESKK